MPASIMEILDLEEVGPDTFDAPTPTDGLERLFGGQVASQTLRAATLTVDEDRPPHSLHAYFLRPGRPGSPIRLEVDRVRDGRSFATRVVTASQGGEAIFTMTASFHGAEPGGDWQGVPMPEVPGPDEVNAPESPLSRFSTAAPFDLRPVRRVEPGSFPVIHPYWIRHRQALGDDPRIHACVVTFMSDFGVVASARPPGPWPADRLMGASLDHAVWFHRPVRADDWLLFDVVPVSNASSRALARGTMWDASGVQVMSMAQEALLRETGREPLP